MEAGLFVLFVMGFWGKFVYDTNPDVRIIWVRKKGK